MSAAAPSAEDLIAQLKLAPLPKGEGGWFRRIAEGPAAGPDGRRAFSVILALFTRGQGSAPHRVDAGETWTWVAGDPFVLKVRTSDGMVAAHRLGPIDASCRSVLARDSEEASPAGRLLQRLRSDNLPLVIVPAGAVQGGEVEDGGEHGWTLVACTCRPEFRVEGLGIADQTVSMCRR